MPPRAIPAAVRRELDVVRRMLQEQHNTAQQRDELIRMQTTTLEQLLTRLNDLTR